MDNKKIEKISSYILCLISIAIIVDTILAQLGIGTYQKGLTLGYCILFILLNTKFPNLSKKKYVIYPLVLLIIQTTYSLISKYF